MRIAAAELAKRRLAEEDRAGGARLGDREAFRSGLVVAKQDRPEGRLHAFDVDLILHDDRNAVQRTYKAPVAFEGGVERRRFVASVWVGGNQRIDRRAFLIVGLDARQIEFDQLTRGQLAAPEGCVHVGNRCLDNVELLTSHAFRTSGKPNSRATSTNFETSRGIPTGVIAQ